MAEKFAKEIIHVNIVDEMRRSYLDYAMSVIVGRALPDVRDGLKPVHRRTLYAMHVLNNEWNKPYKKSARVVGDVIGKYHPHGETAVYDTIVRMAQPFSMRYLLVDGQGNFGSIDGDAPAAMRYTEVRMSQIAHELLADLTKDTVDFLSNYDDSEKEPVVFPTRIPNLLINGSSGIAVGMATNIPPHNLVETINATLALMNDPEISIDELIQQHITGPDFPTAGIICGRRGIYEAYRSGRGRIVVRGRYHIEQEKEGGKEKIIITELPYKVNKATLLEKIAILSKEKKIEGISELRDESDKDGIRVVVDIKRGESGEVVVNNLYQHTKLQSAFTVNMVVLNNNRPMLADLKQVISAFIGHRRDVVTRRSVFELCKAREKAHILEGQAVALTNIDEVIALIKASPTPADAKKGLIDRAWQSGAVAEMLDRAQGSNPQDDASAKAITRPDDLKEIYGMQEDGYHLSPQQAQAILDLRLHRLTALEQDKITSDYMEIINQIVALLKILSNPDKLIAVIRDELIEVREKYGDKRRTEIIEQDIDLTMEDLIPEEDVAVIFSHTGYVKYQSLDTYRAQRRGGRGKAATSMKQEDFVDKLFIASTHDTLLCFSTQGKVYWLKVYKLPQAGRTARGKPIVNLLPLEDGERISAILPVKDFTEEKNIVMATQRGTIKKTNLANFSKPRKSGIKAIKLKEKDQLIGAELTGGNDHIMLFNDMGKAVRFHERYLRSIGRTAAGVRGIRLRDDSKVISLLIVDAEDRNKDVLVATANGYGKRTNIQEFSSKNRGGLGVISIQTSKRNGRAVSAIMVEESDEVMLITTGGVLVRTKVVGISRVGRNAQGVRLIRLGKSEELVEVEQVAGIEDEEESKETEDVSITEMKS